MTHPPALITSAILAWFLVSAPALVAEDDPFSIEAMEFEAIMTALDALGLSLDDPELQNLDNGELWAVIDAHAGKGRGHNGQGTTATTE